MVSYTGERWRKARATALNRDDHTCQKCGSEHFIHAHHVIPARKFDSPEDAHYPENLVALCKWCHPKAEGEPRWPEPGEIESEDGLSHVADLLALRTVSRFATGEAAPEILSKWVFSHPDICASCFEWHTDRMPSNRNPFRSYHRSLYRIVVEDRKLADIDPDTFANKITFCNECKSERILNTPTANQREVAKNHLSTILLEFGFDSSYTATPDLDLLEDVMVHGKAVSDKWHPLTVQWGFSMAFGRSNVSEEVGEIVKQAFKHSSREYNSAGDDEKSPLSGYPDWYRSGLNQLEGE